MITLTQYNAFATRNGLPALTEELLADPLSIATAEAAELSGRLWVPSPATVGQTEARTYYGNSKYTLYIDDALSISSVTIDGAIISDWRGIALESLPIIALERTADLTSEAPRVVGRTPAFIWPARAAVVVTGRFGYCETADLPGNVVEAVATLVALRVVGAPTSWASLTSSVASKIQVLNVTVDSTKDSSTSEAAQNSLRAAAERTLRGYRRVAYA
jgi:hypothetical protein